MGDTPETGTQECGSNDNEISKTSIVIKFYLHGTAAVCGTRFSQTRGPSSHRINFGSNWMVPHIFSGSIPLKD